MHMSLGMFIGYRDPETGCLNGESDHPGARWGGSALGSSPKARILCPPPAFHDEVYLV